MRYDNALHYIAILLHLSFEPSIRAYGVKWCLLKGFFEGFQEPLLEKHLSLLVYGSLKGINLALLVF